MKPNEKQPLKRYGAYQSTIIRKLKKSGLKGEALKMAINAIRQDSDIEKHKLSRRHIKNIHQLINRGQPAVVKISINGKIRIWSLEGLKSVQAHGSHALNKMHASNSARRALKAGELVEAK